MGFIKYIIMFRGVRRVAMNTVEILVVFGLESSSLWGVQSKDLNKNNRSHQNICFVKECVSTRMWAIAVEWTYQVVWLEPLELISLERKTVHCRSSWLRGSRSSSYPGCLSQRWPSHEESQPLGFPFTWNLWHSQHMTNHSHIDRSTGSVATDFINEDKIIISEKYGEVKAIHSLQTKQLCQCVSGKVW